MSRRPYAGVVAETIDHPANGARVEIGRRSTADATRTVGGVTYTYPQGEKPNRSRRFAVFVPEDLGNPLPPAITLSPRLEIAAEGDIRLRGRTIVNGDLRLAGGAVRFVDGADFTADSVPEEPSVYRINDNGKDELRIDLGSGDTATRQFVIGFSSPDGKFTECLRVEMRDTTGTGDLFPLVTITGDLKVDGKILGKNIDPALSAEAQAAILGSFQAGLAAGNVAP